ncbi:hypothetical protein EMPS_11097 [Entomortierella parvispora]|uniref:UBA domain-containing protein n=1 Tax=Entomortierella parvispora TaxID=205924 RepID=A0A9P3HLX3_9FUNG|nr:hypothetical protein EMPS_11097 [Entomortierella parvispora]
MEDLLGLSWDPKSTQQTRPGGAGLGPGASAGTGHKATPPPPVKKPAHLQMGLSKGGLVPTPATSSSFSTSSTGFTSSPQQQPFRGTLASSPASSSIQSKKTADDVFGSLMSNFGQNSAGSDLSKSLSSMTLEERRRNDQQQQQQQYMGSMGRSTPASSSGYSSPALSSASSSSFSVGGINGGSASTISQPTASRPVAFGSQTNTGLSGSFAASSSSSPTPPRGYDPGKIGGFSPLMPTLSSSPRLPPVQSQLQPLPGMTNPGPRNQTSGSSFSNTTPGGLGRSMSPAMTPLQPERSNNASPASTVGSSSNSKDPFDMLLGDQVSRSNSALKNQSLNSIRYNTPPLGQSTSTPKTTGDPWDLDFLANATHSKEPQTTSSDDVFDLGAFEKAPPLKSAGSHNDSVDALSSFIGKQPSSSGSPVAQSVSSASLSEKGSRSSPTGSSHKEGDIAQIVAMGFSADKARLALSMTENGRDIGAAIEYLIQNDEAQEQLPSSRRRTTSTPSSGEKARSRRDDGPPDLPVRPLDDGEDRAWRTKRGTQQSNRDQQQELSRAQQLQQQKDKLVGTASIFGMSVLSKANEFYKQGREKVQAVMEDITAAPEDSKPPGVRRHEWIDDEHKPSRHDQYKDSDSEDDEVFKGRREQQQQQQQRQRQQQQSKQQEYRPRHEKETFEDAYVSSSRRGRGAGSTPKSHTLFSMDEPSSKLSGQPSSKVSPLPASSGSRSTAGRATSPLPPFKPKPTRPPRVLIQANSQQIMTSNQFKEKGNESFKLGQFGQAAELYARAGQALPSGHLLLIVTQNNRAAALLKIGEYRETVAECNRTIVWIQGPDGQGVNDTFLSPSNGTGAETGVQLKDQMGKALMRRANAYENLEKFKEAKEDWTRLRDLDPSHKNAVEGHRRCEKALAMVSSGTVEAKASSSSPSLSRPAGRTPSAAPRSSPMQDLFASNQNSNRDAKTRAELERSEGVSKLRQSAAQQEQEDDEKLRLTDQVDRKMALWKSGKEDNIRALIASLGSVLWEGVGWKAVGMHELVTPQQVKIKYMRAIGKMHPDKLGASTTVEQRMMANTIFSTLNSAWDAFKVQNNM